MADIEPRHRLYPEGPSREWAKAEVSRQLRHLVVSVDDRWSPPEIELSLNFRDGGLRWDGGALRELRRRVNQVFGVGLSAREVLGAETVREVRDLVLEDLREQDRA